MLSTSDFNISDVSSTELQNSFKLMSSFPIIDDDDPEQRFASSAWESEKTLLAYPNLGIRSTTNGTKASMAAAAPLLEGMGGAGGGFAQGLGQGMGSGLLPFMGGLISSGLDFAIGQQRVGIEQQLAGLKEKDLQLQRDSLDLSRELGEGKLQLAQKDFEQRVHAANLMGLPYMGGSSPTNAGMFYRSTGASAQYSPALSGARFSSFH